MLFGALTKRNNIEDPNWGGRWMARQHHDYQREGQPGRFTMFQVWNVKQIVATL